MKSRRLAPPPHHQKNPTTTMPYKLASNYPFPSSLSNGISEDEVWLFFPCPPCSAQITTCIEKTSHHMTITHTHMPITWQSVTIHRTVIINVCMELLCSKINHLKQGHLNLGMYSNWYHCSNGVSPLSMTRVVPLELCVV